MSNIGYNVYRLVASKSERFLFSKANALVFFSKQNNLSVEI